MGEVLTFLHNGYIRLQAITVSLAKIALGGGYGYLSWIIGCWGWSAPGIFRWVGLVSASYFILTAIVLIFRSLPGITPRPRGYRPGRAMIAGLKDLRRSGIVK